MDSTSVSPKTIEKEDIIHLNFSSVDVITDPAKKRLREIYLQKAERYGNGYKGKVKIQFIAADNQVYVVNTTIWSADHEHVSLKHGIVLPTKSILDIEFS
ncbi:MAG: hypothetical protein MUE33_00885 [Cytophagaceae bacterium]|jgi:hypothetical protein|nr:hypothetical protein [Cytophagaceae bacterium]